MACRYSTPRPTRVVAMRWPDYRGKSRPQILFSGSFLEQKLCDAFFVPKNEIFVAENLHISQKSCIFAANLRDKQMAGKRIAMSAAFEWYRGELDQDLYLRSLVKDKHKVMAVCKKPKYTKAQRKKMAERPQIKRFNAVNVEAQKIYHDPVLRAEWEERHEVFKIEAKRKGEYTYPRLWDFIRHELNLAKKEAKKSK